MPGRTRNGASISAISGRRRVGFYLAIVLDLFSRRIVGWAVSNRLKKDLALTGLRRAIAARGPELGLIHHSDRGSQYCSHDYLRLLKAHGMIASMSGKGNCYDSVGKAPNESPSLILNGYG